MSLLIFERYNDRFPPERELLSIEADGSFHMWRSFGSHSAGRFGGDVPDVDLVAELVERAAVLAPPEVGDIEPDASIELISAADAQMEVEAGSRVPGHWGDLAAHGRQLLDELVEQPLAAVRGKIDGNAIFRLEHDGGAALPIELGQLQVRVVRWSHGVEAAVATSSPDGLGPVDAGPGWSLDVPFDPAVLGGTEDDGGQVVGTATFVAVDEGVYVPVVVTAHVV